MSRVVQQYFDREAERFDAIYEDKKPLTQRVIDKLFRGVVRQRLELVETLGPVPGDWSVLDVGCGSGRFGVSLARKGARRVVGVDFAAEMIDLANADAKARQVSDRCEFIASEYLDLNLDERFDLVLALGYYDYMKDPLPHLKRMLEHSRTRLFASFPKRFDFRVPTRSLRIRMGGGFVRFYSHGEVMDLLRDAGVPRDKFTLIELSRDYFLVVNRVE